MKGAAPFRADSSYDGFRRLFIFAFFLAGVLLAGELKTELLFPDSVLFERAALVYGLCLGLVLILSASVWGAALLPVCALVLGCVTGRYANGIVEAFLASGRYAARDLLINAVVIPAFFAAAVQGMRTSSMLGAMLDGSGTSARAAFGRLYAPLALTALGALAAMLALLKG